MADDSEGLDHLRERLKSHSHSLNSLLELIPPKLYVSKDTEEQGGKYFKNKKQKAPKQDIKEASKKAKFAKLDPSQHKTLVELQTESGQKTRSEGGVSVEDVECSNILDLRTKLHQRINLLQRKRKVPNGKASNERKSKKSKRKVKDEKNEKINKVQVSKMNGGERKPITNSEGKVVFSKFDFTSDITAAQSSNAGKQKKTNYKKLLEKAENRKWKLEEMKATDKKKVKDIVKQEAWKKALGKSEGIKPKDDATLLRKTVKRKEKLKVKHKKEWKTRMDGQKKQMKEKQQRREKNIKERIENKKKKKIKKGGRTPGF